MKRLIPILALALLFGCAHHSVKTKTDNSAASGFTAVDDGAKQVDDALGTIEKGPLSDAQQVGVQQAHMGVANVRSGASVAHKAYDASAKLNEPSRQRENYLTFIFMLVGAGVFALGVFLVAGQTSTGVKLGVGLIAAGVGFDAFLLLMRAITPALEYAAYGLAGIGVIAAGYLVYERVVRGRELRKEQQSTKETAKFIPSSAIPQLTPATAALVQAAKTEAVQ